MSEQKVCVKCGFPIRYQRQEFWAVEGWQHKRCPVPEEEKKPVSEPEAEQQPEPRDVTAPEPVQYQIQRNPHIPECAFCHRQVGPLLYAVVPRKPGDKAPFKALVCGDCHPQLLTDALHLLAEANEAALKAWHHMHLPELVPKAERKAVGAQLEATAPKRHKRR